MPILARLHYSLYLTIVLTAIMSLLIVLASSDAIAILPARVSDLAFSMEMVLITYAVSFIFAPWIAHRYPIKRDWQ